MQQTSAPILRFPTLVPEAPDELPADYTGHLEPEVGYPFNCLHHPDLRIRAAAVAALHGAMAARSAPPAPPPLPCPRCGVELLARRVRAVVWLGCPQCFWKLGLEPAQEVALRAAYTGRTPAASPAALIAEWALLALRVRPVGG